MQNDNYQSVWTGPKDSDVGFAAKTEENPSIKGGLTSTQLELEQFKFKLNSPYLRCCHYTNIFKIHNHFISII